MRSLTGKVVVITGASSGIGRAAARAFAAEGARLVLAARDPESLESSARDCRATGAEAIAVPTDVTGPAAVERLRCRAVEQFGRIDVWVNDAAVYAMGSIESTPPEAFRRLFETNVGGVVHGAQAALRQFREQGDRGVLVNVGSVAAHAPYAQAWAYSASKHAIRAITDAIRQEVRGTRIDACLVSPATVDTPLFQHAANYTGREIRAMRPIDAPEHVARAIVAAARRPRRERIVGAAARAMVALHALVPWLFNRMQPAFVERDHLGPEPREASAGNLYAPVPPHAVEGGCRARRSRRSRVAAGAAAAATGMAVVLAAPRLATKLRAARPFR
jgi:NADP-dependent 3-hydroxy acid dehydrogenase YdfG